MVSDNLEENFDRFGENGGRFEEKYFSGLKAKDRADLVMQALEAWFAGKETVCVQQ